MIAVGRAVEEVLRVEDLRGGPSDGSATASDRRQPAERVPGDDQGMPFAAVIAHIEETTLFIAIVDFSTTAADRPTALACLDAECDQVRAMPGNLAFRVCASRDDDGRITVVHEWDDEASFDGYLRSDSFARFSDVLRPMMVGAPVSRRFRAEPVRAVA